MNLPKPNSFRSGPDERGHFGLFGGRFVAETLMPLILSLEQAYAQARLDPSFKTETQKPQNQTQEQTKTQTRHEPSFKTEMDGYLTHYVGRPSPLYIAERLT